MYATSPRCLARIQACRGLQRGSSPSSRRLLSSFSSVCNTKRRRRPRSLRDGRASTPSTATPNLAIASQCSGRGARHYASSVYTPPRSIAVLGGGLTGLTTAWYLTRVLPQAKITLYEANDRLGGWVDSEKVEVQTPDGNKGTVHFERAARMIKPQTSGRIPRYDDLVFFDMVAHLGLAGELVHNVSTSPLAGYIYYPDHLVQAPNRSTTLLTCLTTLMEPAFRDFFRAIPRIMFVRRPTVEEDMSVGEYVSQWLGGPGIVDKILSGVVHGITGGDVWNLSLRNGPFADALAGPSKSRAPTGCAWIRQYDFDLMEVLTRDKATFDLARRYRDADAIWFRSGFSTLTNALAAALRNNPNVTIKTNEPIESIRYLNGSDRVALTSKKQPQPVLYEKVVSTIFAKTLAGLTDGHLPSLAKSTAVNIQLVNLWYPVPFANAPYHGFGYLIPQAVDFDQNPECALGVIFDSDREFQVPSRASPDVANRGADTIHGTKLTVMLGGHYWDGLPESFLPSPADAVEMAKRVVERHLRLDPSLTQQAVASTKLCRNCIPQHVVGHGKRMWDAHGELEWAFKGRLAVAGQSYTPPGVLGSVRAARDVAMQIGGAWRGPNNVEESVEAINDEEERARIKGIIKAHGGVAEWLGTSELKLSLSVGDTGLARFGKTKFVAVPKVLLPLRFNAPDHQDDEDIVKK